MSRFESIMQHIQHVPLLSPVISHLIQLFGEGDHALTEVTRLVEIDQNLTMQVLRSVNSAAHTSGRTITSVHQAVVRLGMDHIFSIALRTCSGDLMLRSLEGYSAQEGELWRHSLMTALIAKESAERDKQSADSNLAYTAGLLHDIGKPVLDHFLHSPLPCEESSYCDDMRLILAMEKDRLGIHHAEAGALLAEHWCLPLEICEAIRYHHSPDDAPEEFVSLTKHVAIGDFLSLTEGIGNNLDGFPDKVELGSACFNSLNIDLSDAESMTKRALILLQDSEKTINAA
jgi:putative nucleotidyltransferase with HDIG domain